jgi:hypothetical protein
MELNWTKGLSQYSLFSLGMFTYTYERQDIIQIGFKRVPGGGSAVKKRFVPPFTCYNMNCWKNYLIFHSTPKMDYDQTAMGLPPVSSAVFHIAKSFW